MTRRTWWLLAGAIAGLAFVASANSVVNGFAYDDVGLIRDATRMHSMDGWWREFANTYWPGADGYRPLTIIAFRAQWALGGGSPTVFHAANVLLHVATAVAVFWFACALLPLAAAWIAAALYAVHPVHVEAIANVVGQSDLLVTLFLVLAVGLYIRARSGGGLSARQWVIIGVLYAAACLVKEHAIVLPALLLLAEATVVTLRTPLGQRVASIRVPLMLLVVVAVGYLWARDAVIVGPASGFQPYIVFTALDLGTTDRVLTMIGAAPEWLRLFVWPAHLMTQYAPPHIEVAQGPSVAQLPGLLVLLGTVGLLIACWRRSPVTSFGIGWMIITLLPASNFILPAGFIIAERTLMLPSVGALVAICSAVPWLHEKVGEVRVARVAAATAVALVLGLGITRSYERNRVWHDDESLHRQGIVDSPDSYRAHYLLGFHLFSRGNLREGEWHYRRAIELFPHDPLLAWTFAEQLRTAGRCDAAIPIYRWLYTAYPDGRRGHLGYAACLVQYGHLDEARKEALHWLRRGGRVSEARAVLASVKAVRDSAGAHPQ